MFGEEKIFYKIMTCRVEHAVILNILALKVTLRISFIFTYSTCYFAQYFFLVQVILNIVFREMKLSIMNT